MAKYNKQISLGYDDNGKRIRKWIHAESKQELKRRERELLMNADDELRSNLTFGVFAQSWFEAYKSNKSERTQAHYKSMLKHCSALSNKRLKSIRHTDLQRVVTAHSDRPVMAQRIAGTLKQIMEAAMADGLVSPMHIRLEVPKTQKSKKRALTKKEKNAIREAELPPMERLMLDFVFYLGLRPQEMRALARSDFNWTDNTVTVSKAVSDVLNVATLKGTKTGAVRILPLPAVLVSEIKQYLSVNKQIYLFTNDKGELLTRYQYDLINARIFDAVFRALGHRVTDLTFYTLRHNRATELYYLDGVSTKKKAEYMGHSELMFLKTYSHLDDAREETELLRKIL